MVEGGVKTKPISSLSLSDLRQMFGVERDRHDSFFKQWLAGTEALSAYEEQALVRLRQNYRNVGETNPLEEVVKLVVVSPLLDLAGFYQPLFSIRAEVPTTLAVPDNGQTFIGKIDVLAIRHQVQHQVWVFVIESKQAKFDISIGIPQAIGYLISQPSESREENGCSRDTDRPRFGMVTNGREVVFLKLMMEKSPIYTQSSVYQVADEEEDLPQVLQGLKWIGTHLSES